MVRDTEVYDILLRAVRKGVELVKEYEQQDQPLDEYTFPKYNNFPALLSNNESYHGLPYFWSHSCLSSESPKYYSYLFGTDIMPENIAEWQAFIKLAQTHSVLLSHYKQHDYRYQELNKSQKFIENTFFRHINTTVADLVDRYLHTVKSIEFDEPTFQEIYCQWEEAIFAEQLVFDVMVPIVFVKFDFEQFDIAPHVRIERMDENFQLARNTESYQEVAVNESVIGAATHALVLSNHSIENTLSPGGKVSFRHLETFKQFVPDIDQFFASLRTATGAQTGYGQIIARPIGWAESWTAYLPDIRVIFVRAYPDEFENLYESMVPPILSKEDCNEISAIYNSLASASANQILIASRRLNAAYLRRSEEDSILDITIGLEALLVKDGKTGEITHKLAMRLAAVCKMQPFETYTPSEVFALCKKIYDFRSAVAHGTHEVDKKRYLDDKQKNVKVPIVEVALALLRHALTFFCSHNEFLDSQKLDMSLLE